MFLLSVEQVKVDDVTLQSGLRERLGTTYVDDKESISIECRIGQSWCCDSVNRSWRETGLQG